ncbi:tyrosine-type recombinase/integrase [Pantoea sp. Al-1710]|uniref:Tyrosine-type recombinase/integrase n=1 Tax=Candidatus Pantoea communis TaxID=2608354 RepID=A0ABX0RIC3_9GAMM|nr:MULTISPECIES: phage integrase Arm DNA-binding domain-containing protein [Pantoea]NIG12906.1 tyrosine-type recombinase/integrase [Pantoea sp. Cy-640]NIG17393.1 tyrosine-type recombinase/integrase [Pantoea communis]
MARRRSTVNRDLPPNLYVRNQGYYSYKDPRSGKEYGLGRDKRSAITQAIEANLELYQDLAQPVKLLDRMNEVKKYTLNNWLESYEKELDRRKLASKTMESYTRFLKTIKERMGAFAIEDIDTKVLADFLAPWRDDGKATMHNRIRNFLKDVFSTAIAHGVLKVNPIEYIKTERVTVVRERLSLDEFKLICDNTPDLYPWAKPCFELALLTGQRIGDIQAMKWEDIRNNKIYVIQQKTGSKVAIDTAHGLKAIDKTIKQVLKELEQFKDEGGFVIPVSGGRDKLSRAFLKSRESSKLKWEGTAPSFHEIRSLSARLYKEENDGEFSQRLLGHKNSAMTDKYTDTRDNAFVEV